MLCIFHKEFDSVKSLLIQLLTSVGAIKFQLCLYSQFLKEAIDEDIITRIYICSSTRTLINSNNTSNQLNQIKNDILNNIDLFIAKGSGWRLQRITHAEVRVGKYVPRTGGCVEYKLPKWLIVKKAILNITTQSKCFHYAVIASIYSKDNPRPFRKTFYKKYWGKFNFLTLSNIVSVEDVPKFEKANDMSINIYCLDECEKQVVPLKVNKTIGQKHANLFYYKNHYYTIINFNRLLSSKKSWAHHYCYNCLQGFKSQELLKRHSLLCNAFSTQRIVLPNKKVLEFDQCCGLLLS